MQHFWIAMERKKKERQIYRKKEKEGTKKGRKNKKETKRK